MLKQENEQGKTSFIQNNTVSGTNGKLRKEKSGVLVVEMFGW